MERGALGFYSRLVVSLDMLRNGVIAGYRAIRKKRFENEMIKRNYFF